MISLPLRYPPLSVIWTHSSVWFHCHYAILLSLLTGLIPQCGIIAITLSSSLCYLDSFLSVVSLPLHSLHLSINWTHSSLWFHCHYAILLSLLSGLTFSVRSSFSCKQVRFYIDQLAYWFLFPYYMVELPLHGGDRTLFPNLCQQSIFLAAFFYLRSTSALQSTSLIP